MSSTKFLRVSPLLLSVKEIVKDDNIFRLHSVSAGLFGSFLLFKSDLLASLIVNSGALKAGQEATIIYAYQQWAIFILAISAITFSATSFESNAKQVLRRVIGSMCASEALLSGSNIVLYDLRYNPVFSIIDAITGGVFLILAYGYFVAETTSSKK